MIFLYHTQNRIKMSIFALQIIMYISHLVLHRYPVTNNFVQILQYILSEIVTDSHYFYQICISSFISFFIRPTKFGIFKIHFESLVRIGLKYIFSVNWSAQLPQVEPTSGTCRGNLTYVLGAPDEIGTPPRSLLKFIM